MSSVCIVHTSTDIIHQAVNVHLVIRPGPPIQDTVFEGYESISSDIAAGYSSINVDYL